MNGYPDDDDPEHYMDTTEPNHDHYCFECGCVWSHNDESCIGPRFRGYSPYDPTFSCPRCVDEA